MAHCLAKFGIGLLVLTGYLLFCWGVFISPNSSHFVSVISLTLCLFNSAGIVALWVFYLSKHFSTHTVKVMDIKESVKERKPVVKASVPTETDDEKEIKDFASSVTAQIFSKTKEKLNDSLL